MEGNQGSTNGITWGLLPSFSVGKSSTWIWNQCHQTSVSTCLFWCLMIFITYINMYIYIYVCDIWYVCICLSISIYVHLSSYLHRVWHTSMVSSNNLYPTLQHPEVWPSASTSTTTRVVWWIKSKRFWGQKSTFGRGCSKPHFDDFLGEPWWIFRGYINSGLHSHCVVEVDPTCLNYSEMRHDIWEMHIWLKEIRVLARIHPKNDRHRIHNIQGGLSWKLLLRWKW